MNRSYSKIRHIQESNLILERRLLIKEQPDGTENNPNKLPGAKVTAKSAEKRLVTSFKDDTGGTGTWAGYVKMDPTTKKWNLTGVRFSLRNSKYGGDRDTNPLLIQNNNIMRGELKDILQNGEMGYSGPGMSPLGSLTNLVNQISKQTGVQYGIGGDLQSTLKTMPNRYYTYSDSKVQKGSYLKPDINFGVKKQTNPDNNQVLNRYLYIGSKYDPSLSIIIEPSGQLRNVGMYSVQSVTNNLLKTGTQYLNVNPNDDYAKDNVMKSIKSLQYQGLL